MYPMQTGIEFMLSRAEPEQVEPGVELTILLPCLNEAGTLAACIRKAKSFLKANAIAGEIVVADNGSTDGSPRIAAEFGARVVGVAERGYGAALLGGIEAARGRYVVMGDADDSYDFTNLGLFVDKLRRGADIVIGNRFAGGIAPGAMPFLHKYLGNPVLSFLGRLFFSFPVRDFHCGLRAFRAAAVRDLGLRSAGMEFASEMVVRSSLAGLTIVEVPTTLQPDGRSRPPHLKTWRDGWRHLKFLLMYSPRWLFFIPGAALIALGLLLTAMLSWGPIHVFRDVVLDVNTFISACFFTIAGVQLVSFGAISRAYAAISRLLRRHTGHGRSPPCHDRPSGARRRVACHARSRRVWLRPQRLGHAGLRPAPGPHDPTHGAGRHGDDRHRNADAVYRVRAGVSECADKTPRAFVRRS